MGAPTLVLLNSNDRGICGLIYWNQTLMQMGKGLVTTSTQILPNQIHTCCAQVVITTSNFVHLENQVGGTF